MKIIECPRDAMQGISPFIPTELKVRYLNTLLRVGFDTLDFGSFVSPRHIPQMKDTAEVFKGLETSNTHTHLLAIVPNLKGAERCAEFPQIRYMGFPLSISETFQQRNTNRSISEALKSIEAIQKLCQRTSQQLVVYLSMAFGNPYGEEYTPNVLGDFIQKMQGLEVPIIQLSDTIGVAEPDLIERVFRYCIRRFPEMEIGAHFHSNPRTALEKVQAAYAAGCRRFDGALKGYGGCPMAKDELTGNIATELMVGFFREQKDLPHMDWDAFEEALQISNEVFAQARV